MNTVQFQAEYEFGSTLYYVKFGTVKSKATIICIDTEEICNERLESILSYRPNPLLQTKINKKPSGKAAEAIIDKTRDECKIQLLESQIVSMQEKINQLEAKSTTDASQIEILSKKNLELEEKNAKKDAHSDFFDKEKLISIASCIFNNFGKLSDVENLILQNDHQDNEVNIILNKIFKNI